MLRRFAVLAAVTAAAFLAVAVPAGASTVHPHPQAGQYTGHDLRGHVVTFSYDAHHRYIRDLTIHLSPAFHLGTNGVHTDGTWHIRKAGTYSEAVGIWNTSSHVVGYWMTNAIPQHQIWFRAHHVG